MNDMENQELKLKSIGEIVADDFRTASLFKDANIDFCCGGKMSLEEACTGNNVNIDLFKEKLEELKLKPQSKEQNYKEWDLGFLCDYIVNTHHLFVKKSLPELVSYTHKIASVHGMNHPELEEIADLFQKINDELLQHLKNEEEVLFPAIKETLKNNLKESKQTIFSEITRLKGEHEFAGGAMDKINRISKRYQLPSDACNTYSVAFQLLEQFENDLHIHVHLENNILFPKALQLTN
jgi:regulator of cell morphogenesis and NO signaling